jgi:hypothetical protein
VVCLGPGALGFVVDTGTFLTTGNNVASRTNGLRAPPEEIFRNQKFGNDSDSEIGFRIPLGESKEETHWTMDVCIVLVSTSYKWRFIVLVS